MSSDSGNVGLALLVAGAVVGLAVMRMLVAGGAAHGEIAALAVHAAVIVAVVAAILRNGAPRAR